MESRLRNRPVRTCRLQAARKAAPVKRVASRANRVDAKAKPTVSKSSPKQKGIDSFIADAPAQAAPVDKASGAPISKARYRRLYKPILRNAYTAFEKPVTRRADCDVCDCAPGSCCENCFNAAVQVECVARFCPCGKDCKNRRFARREYAPFSIRDCGSKGLGFFAERAIPRGAFIIEYVGEVIDQDELEARLAAPKRHWYAMEARAGMYIDSGQRGNEARFINHSCSPNAETQKWTRGAETLIGIFALRDIEAGEEVTFNYNFESFGEKQECRCGSDECKGFL
eukprot:gnl/Chilomastix_cuspidata/1434.p3 GENE.gnl/Chilomastix_cuspidata/1434~~gnl/Chilomastix_cuspidata/1434.p3  ORF type:complete len:284 (+),score=110.36 gnl/Chilomastix_cuspidata/1434:2142-2993(+)